ncbi:hypothetical protein OJ998_20245 [Solirubrobacter taibaiensis]|nr:hypothetical protein [Solirubrobacter taibaiensis]
MPTIDLLRPTDVCPTWPRAQHAFELYAREAPPSPHVLRTTGLLAPDRAERVTEWFLAPGVVSSEVRRSYRALGRESLRLADVARGCLGVRVAFIDQEAYMSGADLCADLREHGTLVLVREDPHPLLSASAFDALRVVHDVFGHAALGVGFDLQSEYATWLQCRTLFSPAARPAAFCELVGAVTAYVSTGVKPGLRAKVAPAEWVG